MGSTLEGSKEKIIFEGNYRGRKKTRLILIYFLCYLSAKGLSHKTTIDPYRCNLIKYIDFLKENKIDSFDQVNKNSIRSYSAYLKKEGYKVKSIPYKLKIIRIFYRFMFSEGYINKDIYNLIKLHQKENKFHIKSMDRTQIKGCLKEFLRCEKIKTVALTGISTKLLCKDCIDFTGTNIFIRGCYGERLKECEYKVDLLKVV